MDNMDKPLVSVVDGPAGVSQSDPNAWLEAIANASLSGRAVYWVNELPTVSNWSLFGTSIKPQRLAEFLLEVNQKLKDEQLSPLACEGVRLLLVHPDWYNKPELLAAREVFERRFTKQEDDAVTQEAGLRVRDVQARLEKRHAQLIQCWQNEGYEELASSEGPVQVLKRALTILPNAKAAAEVCVQFPRRAVELFVHYLHDDKEYVDIAESDLPLINALAEALGAEQLQIAVAVAMTEGKPWEQILPILRETKIIQQGLPKAVAQVLREHVYEIADYREVLQVMTQQHLTMLCGHAEANASEREIWLLVKAWAELHQVPMKDLPVVELVHIEHLQQIDGDLYLADTDQSPVARKDRVKWSEQRSGKAKHWERPCRTRHAPRPEEARAAPAPALAHALMMNLDQLPAKHIMARVAELAANRAVVGPKDEAECAMLRTLIARARWEKVVDAGASGALQTVTTLWKTCSDSLYKTSVRMKYDRLEGARQRLPMNILVPGMIRVRFVAVRELWHKRLVENPWDADFQAVTPVGFRPLKELATKVWTPLKNDHTALCTDLLMMRDPLFEGPYESISKAFGFGDASAETIQQMGAAARLLWLEAGIHGEAREELLKVVEKDYLTHASILTMASAHTKELLFTRTSAREVAPIVWVAARACKTDESVLQQRVTTLNWEPFPDTVARLFGSNGPDSHLMPMALLDQLLSRPEQQLDPADEKIAPFKSLTEVRPSYTNQFKDEPGLCWIFKTNFYGVRAEHEREGPLVKPVKFGPDRLVRLVVVNQQVVVQYKGLMQPTDRWVLRNFANYDNKSYRSRPANWIKLDRPAYVTEWTTLLEVPKITGQNLESGQNVDDRNTLILWNQSLPAK